MDYQPNLSLIGKPRKDRLGDIRAEVFGLRTADKAELAITRIPPRVPDAGQAAAPPSVVLVHGTYSTRNFWVSPKGIGMGSYLADQGYDVWIPELRGHGLSPKPAGYAAISAEDHIRADLPAIQNFVKLRSSGPVFWIGHSFGGLYVIAALSMKWLDQSNMAGLVAFGSQISHGDRYLKVPPLAWTAALILKTIGYFPAPRLGLGPEIEPAGVILETIRWKRLFGKWTTSTGASYWEGLRDIRLPVLTMAAENDRNDPPVGCKRIHDYVSSPDKTFLRLGKNFGFSMDYDHVGMVVSRAAQGEVWPMVARWIADRGCGQED